MKKIAVTGGSGYFGGYVIREFMENGYEVLNIDMKYPKEKRCRTLIADLNSIGEAYEALKESGTDILVNLAAIPQAYLYTDEATVRTNIMTTYNVLSAASNLGFKRVATASSDSSYGMVFSRRSVKPEYLPIDEEYPQAPADPYGFSKLINEKTAEMFSRKTGMETICLRIVHVELPENYKSFKQENGRIDGSFAKGRVTELWNYIDARDAACAFRLAVEKEGLRTCALNIAADETCMDVETKELLSHYYPGVTDIRENVEGYSPLLLNRKAKRLLGWKPVHSWRA